MIYKEQRISCTNCAHLVTYFFEHIFTKKNPDAVRAPIWCPNCSRQMLIPRPVDLEVNE